MVILIHLRSRNPISNVSWELVVYLSWRVLNRGGYAYSVIVGFLGTVGSYPFVTAPQHKATKPMSVYTAIWFTDHSVEHSVGE